MDIVVVMFGSLISTMSALTFLEVRRIRKMMRIKAGCHRNRSANRNSA